MVSTIGEIVVLSGTGTTEACDHTRYMTFQLLISFLQVVFETTRAAKICVEKFNQATKMGNLMTVFTDPLGKERQGYIDEKVYGIPRRQVDYRSDFNPKPEVYVEPSERSHTPHIPTGQTPHISTQTPYLSHDPNLPNEYGEYPEENYQDNSGHLEHPQYPQQEGLENHNHGHPPTNDRLREPEQMPYENGYREEEERLNMDNRRRDRDHFTNRDDGKMRDLYNERDQGKLNRYDSRDDRRGNYHNRRDRDNRDYNRDRDRYRDRDRDRDRGERRYDRRDDRRDEWDKARDSQDNRSRDRDSRYGRGQTISRHGRDSEQHREPLNIRPNQTETEIDRHLELNILRDIDKLRSRLEEQPSASLESTDSHIHPQDQHGGESETLTADASPAEDTSPAADPGGLDLDSRIMMMLNQNKDLAGFGAPEPVAPSDAVPAPMMPLDPQTGQPPPVMPHQAHYPPGAPIEGQYSSELKLINIM